MALGPLLLTQTGCGGIRWHGWNYEFVHADAERDNQLTFAYLRNWYMVECTEFEEYVLKTQPVRDLLADVKCAMLEFDWSESLVKQWGFTKPPAFVIVAPDDRVLARGEGQLSLDEVVSSIQRAKAQFSQASQPANPP